MENQSKDICKLVKNVCDRLGLNPYPIKYETLGVEDSRIYFQEEYIAINIIHKNDFLESAKCITHELRHIFQVFYANLFDNERARRWKELLTKKINYDFVNDSENYAEYYLQELEVDAFAFTKWYMKEFLGMDVKNKIVGYDEILDSYIKKNINIF